MKNKNSTMLFSSGVAGESIQKGVDVYNTKKA